MRRMASIDLVRGLVMIIMPLDHVRDLMHITALSQSPTDLETTTPILFFTRWITYLCAPVFVFLAGTSAFLAGTSADNPDRFRKNLLLRGAGLLVMEFTVVSFGVFFDPGFHTLLFEVIASTGFGFIALGLLVHRLSLGAMGVAGLLIIFLHNLVPSLPTDSLPGSVLAPLFSPSAIPLGAGRVFVMAYPPLPWLGVMLVGFACGPFFRRIRKKRKMLFLNIGAAALALFVVLRFTNGYGDPAPWINQGVGKIAFLSFMNITKYPPSMLFCLATLGLMFVLLAGAERFRGKAADIIATYGRTPMFFFIVHFYLIHLATVTMLLLQGFGWQQLEFASGTFGRPVSAPSGISLWAVYLLWVAVVALLYYPCRWFGAYKASHKHWWLRYL